MSFPVIHLGIICIFFSMAASQSCYFDFEDDSELLNFNTECNGALGAWSISDAPTNPHPPLGTGDRVLVNTVQETSCMQSYNEIEVQEDQKMTVYLFVKKPGYPDSYSLDISLICQNGIDIWHVLPPAIDEPNGEGEWLEVTNVFHTTPNLMCTVEIRMYRNGKAEVAIDKLTIVDPVSADDCYVVPKVTTTIQPEETSTTPEPTTEPETDQTSDSTSDPTTDQSTTQSTNEPTTTSGSTKEPTTNSPSNSPATTAIPNTTSRTTSAETTPTAPTSTTDATTREPAEGAEDGGYSDFSIFYMVIIIAVSGGLALLSAGICYFIIRLGRQKKKYHKKMRWLS